MEGATSIRRAAAPDAPAQGEAPERSSRPLLAPESVRRALPASPEARATVQAGRERLRDLVHGRDPRLAVVVGPCSIHDPEAALDYARRLARAAEGLADALVVVMRLFVEKPRTAMGWKGLLNDPTLDGRCDIGLGLATARQLLLRINELGLPCGTELLEPLAAPYLRDLVAWGGVGARTSASPVHRQLASDAPFPIAFKNGIDGDLDVAIHGMRVAQRPQTFLATGDDGRCIARSSEGNPDVHLVLRGGRGGPNYDQVSIAKAARSAAELGIARPVMVDCSHDNSGGDPRNQSFVCRATLDALRSGSPGLLGLMLESHLEEGRQDAGPGARLRYGVSITDACIGWTETHELLEEMAAAVRSV